MPARLFGGANTVHDPRLFKAVLALHVIAATVWVGGGVMLALLGVVGRGRDHAVAVLGREAARLGSSSESWRRLAPVRRECSSPTDAGVRRVPLRWALLTGPVDLGILMDEVPPARDGEQRKHRPLHRIKPTEPVPRQCPRDLPPTSDQAPRSKQRDLEVEHQCPGRQPALSHGRSINLACTGSD
jgi:hypothetical protein